MAERLDGKYIQGIGELGVVELSVEQCGGHAHRVYADQCGFCWIDGIVCQAISDLEAAEVGKGDRNGR